jgi:hypothetical protein
LQPDFIWARDFSALLDRKLVSPFLFRAKGGCPLILMVR